MAETFTIGRLAEAAGVNVETVRYYERRGLLEQPSRAGGGYRQYSASELWRLQFIRRAKDLGFTLSEISDLLGSRDRSTRAVLDATRAKVAVVEARLRELDQLRYRLTQLAEICERGDASDCVNLEVGQLATEPPRAPGADQP
ncbi:MAG: MerR family transcriptional regulator [Acidimicrobiales bacterium]